MAYYTYILTSKRFGTLYTGSTNNLVRRIWEHREDLQPGFSAKYGVHRLVWYEEHATIEGAAQREKRIKHWLRTWKIALIEERNPEWRDLWEDIAHF